MIILSVDPGLARTGCAVFKKDINIKPGYKLITSGLIETDKSNPTSRRLNKIYTKLSRILSREKPHLIVVEEIFFFKNKKTIISVSQAQGIILLLAGKLNIPVEYLSPLKIKQTVTGYGLSDKKAIKKMVDLTLHPFKKNIGDDEYDAIACGLAYCFQNNQLLK